MDESMETYRNQLVQKFHMYRPAQNSTNISRAAVSHHLKILKDAGIINVRHEGTKNFYYLDSASSSLLAVSELFHNAIELMKQCPVHKEENI